MIRVWDLLGIPSTSDRDAIRRAYARKLRVTHPEDDPEGFKRLREAYEAALRHHDYIATWGDDEDDSESADESGVATATLDPVAIEAVEATPDPALAALLATREQELADLNTLIAAFDAGLRGQPWRASDAVLERQFAEILALPAMDDILVRGDVEARLAALLATTIPHSDAVLLQAIRAFGWENEGQRHGGGWVVTQLLERLDEWRLIERISRPPHPYYLGWQSLVSAPGPYWRWRLNAFRPSVVHGAAALVEEYGMAPDGLRHSFKPESAARWQAFLARPRLTLGMLCQIPVMFAAVVALASLLPGNRGASLLGYAAAAILGCAAPAITLYVLAPFRLRLQQDYHSPWLRDGWLAAYAAIPFAAMLLPGPYWSAIIMLSALATAIWAYLHAIAADSEPARITARLLLGVGAVLIGLGLLKLDPANMVALLSVAALYMHFRISRWSTIRIILGRTLGMHREWKILGGTMLALVAAIGVGLWHARTQPASSFTGAALCLLAILPFIGAPARDAGEMPSRRLVWVIVAIAYAWAFVAGVPSSSPRLPASGEPAASTVPLAGTLDSGMEDLERKQPGIRRLRDGNPALHAEIRAALARYYDGKATRSEASTAIATIVNTAYRRMQPETGNDLLVAGLRLRLERLQTLQTSAPQLCDAKTRESDETALPSELRDRQMVQLYSVISSPPAPAQERAAGRIIDAATISRRAGILLHGDTRTLLDALEGKKGAAGKCAGLAALTQALLDSDRLDDIAATLRDQFRRRAKTKSMNAKAGSRN